VSPGDVPAFVGTLIPERGRRGADEIGGSRTGREGPIDIALIAGHRLWERPQDPAARERVTLVNHVTVALGVVTLLAALLVVTTLPCAKRLTATVQPRIPTGAGDDPEGNGRGLGDPTAMSCSVTMGGLNMRGAEIRRILVRWPSSWAHGWWAEE
jgi:hypothetical protein